MPRKEIEFKTTDQVTLRGWLYTPNSPPAQTPCLVMAHGWACIKEMELPKLAEHFTTHLPISVLIYDHRGFGASDTAPNCPRREIVPAEQVSDMSDAVTHAASLEAIDANRIGIWGYSFAGGHAISTGASDPRVKAVIAQNPVVSGWQNVRRLMSADSLEVANAAFAADRLARVRGEEPGRLPVAAADPSVPSSMPTAGAYKFFFEWEKKSDWKNDVTVRTCYLNLTHEPMGQVQYISPRPLLMVVAEKDVEAPADIALEAFSQAKEPKELQLVPEAGHFDMFDDGILAKTLEVQTAFLRRWLCS